MAKWKMPDRDQMDCSRGLDQDGDFDHDGNCASSPTTPFAFNGSPGRRSCYVRSQSLNGRIQKPSVARSQSFNGKCGKLLHRSHHMDTLQARLLYMNANGVDQKKFVNVLDKLKDMYLSRGEQQQQQQEDRRTALKPPSMPSPLSSSQTFQPRLETAAESSSIALLQNKFAQLERYKESVQGQQIQVYPSHNFRSGHSSAHLTPASSSPCSPYVGVDDSYYFDDGTAALIALQQEMMSNSSRSPTASGLSAGDALNHSQESMGTYRNPLNSQESMGTYRNPLNSSESTGTYRSPLNSGQPIGTYRSPLNSQSESMISRSPGHWSACESSDVSGSTSPQSDVATNALLHYILQPPNVGRPPHNNSNAFQSMSLAGGPTAMGSAGLGGTTTPDSLGSFLAAERMEILTAKKAAPETKFASSIQQVVAKFPFNLTAKFSSPKTKLQAAWGKSLSLNTPVVPTTPSDYSGEESWESDSSASQTYSNSGQDVQWHNNSGRECSNDMYMKQQELMDTSLHL